MKHMKKIILYLFLSAGLSSCHLYRTYERPDMEVSDSLYRQPPMTQDTVSLAALSWTELFTDPELQQLIKQGICNNTDLNIARLKIKEAEALLLTSKLFYLPSFSLTSQGTLGSTEDAKTTKTYNLAGSADWEIDIFGKLTNAKRGAKAVLEQSEAYRQAVQTQLVATIANSYYSLLMLDKQIDITRRTLTTWEENLRVMKALKKAGQTTEMAVAQAEANKLSIERSLFSIEQQICEIENSLSALLGITPQKIIRSALDGQEFPETLSMGIPLQLLQRRPDIRQKEAELAQAFYITNQAHAAFYPSIILNGSAGWSNSVGGTIVNPGRWLLSAIGSLVQPIFNRGKNIANLKIAKAQQEETLLAFRQSLLNAGTEVNDALMQWQTARKRIELSKQQVVSLQGAVRSSELLMQYSSQNYLEVLTAQQTLLQAELSVASDRFDEIQGIVNLYHALGGGY